MFVLGNFLLVLVVVACDAGVVHEPSFLEYGVKAVPANGAYKPVIGYQTVPAYGIPQPVPVPAVGYGLQGPVPVGGAINEIGALPYGASVGGLKPFGSYRSLFGGPISPYGKGELVAPAAGYGIAPVATPVKEVKEYTSPVALKQYSSPVVLREYVPGVALKEYSAPVALKGYAAPAVGYPVAQAGYYGAGIAGYRAPAIGYGVPGGVANGYVPAVPVKGYPAPLVVPKQEEYGLVKKFDW